MMSLKDFLHEGRLTRHKTSKDEIRSLMQVVDRDIKDAKVPELSTDRKFATAYNAVLILATVPIYCKGYKTKGEGHHFFTFQTLKFILDKKYFKLVDYFDDCRTKRNMLDYDHTGRISDKEAKELIIEAESFKKIILQWTKKHYPEYLLVKE